MIVGGEGSVGPAVLAAAREWLGQQAVVDETAAERSDESVIVAVWAVYPGGWPAFLQAVRPVSGENGGEGGGEPGLSALGAAPLQPW